MEVCGQSLQLGARQPVDLCVCTAIDASASVVDGLKKYVYLHSRLEVFTDSFSLPPFSI